MAGQLDSWNDGGTRQAIEAFIARVTRVGSPDFVPEDERVAVFDNDGTLWCEKPLPIQADFLMRRLGQMAEQDPSLRSRQPWKAVVERDYQWLGGVIDKHYHGDDRDLRTMADGMLRAYAGSNIEEFEALAGNFLRTAEHPHLRRPYRKCAYQPMVDLLRLLEVNGFTNYLVTGGGRDFLRPLSEELYGIPSERVIGSSAALEYKDGGQVATIVHKPQVDIFDDGPTKPVQIWSRTGRRPVFAAGNSNGDIAMLHFCAHPSRPSFSLLLNHDDDRREYAYQAGAEESLERARTWGWTVASLRNDWRTVFVS
jgi:phosphoglycolate phosphatase-like HAD superfamily hydrolase